MERRFYSSTSRGPLVERRGSADAALSVDDPFGRN